MANAGEVLTYKQFIVPVPKQINMHEKRKEVRKILKGCRNYTNYTEEAMIAHLESELLPGNDYMQQLTAMLALLELRDTN